MLATPPTRPSQSVGGTDWKGGWHRLERWVAPIGKVGGTDWKGGWHRLGSWVAPIGKVGGTDWKGDFQFLVEVRIYGKLLDAGDAMPLQAASQLQGPAPHQPFVFEDNFWDRWS